MLFSFHVNAERRFQIWNKNDVIINVWEKFDISFSEKTHYSTNNNNLDLIFGDLFLFHKPLNWLDYGAGYRIAYANILKNSVQENRAMVIVNFKKNYNKFNFKFSNRFEHRAFKVDFDHFRFKQQFTVMFPPLTPWGMQFYTSEETFTKLNGDGTHLARFYGGISGFQNDNFQLKLYYAMEKYKFIENWNTTDILGLNLSFMF